MLVASCNTRIGQILLARHIIVALNTANKDVDIVVVVVVESQSSDLKEQLRSLSFLHFNTNFVLSNPLLLF